MYIIAILTPFIRAKHFHIIGNEANRRQITNVFQELTAFLWCFKTPLRRI